MAEAGFSQDKISCSVCLDLLQDPVTFPCGHSYCMNCFTFCWNNQTQGYSCSQCQHTPRPAFGNNVMFADVMKKLDKINLQTALPDHCNTKPEDVVCDVCTGRKHKAAKSCLECLKSYCLNHLKQHENLFQFDEHHLMDPAGQLNGMICPKHRKPLEIYCRTDQQCICYPCLMEEHKNHETVTVEAEKTEKQMHLRETLRKVQQRIQEREKALQEVREAVETHKRSAETAVKDSEKIFTDLVRFLETCHFKVTQLIRDQEKIAVSQAENLWNQLQWEINDLRRRNAELEQLSQIDGLISFLQSFQSLSAARDSTVSHSVTVNSLLSFDDVRKSLSQLKDKLENFCKEEIEKLSYRVTYVTFIRPNKPRTREEFSQYYTHFTLDPNTVNHYIHLSDENRTATDTDAYQGYPYHPERFDYCAQVLCRESVCGRCYWEVEWSGSAGVYISVSYKTISRKSNEDECLFGQNDQSWGVYCCASSGTTPPSNQLSEGTNTRLVNAITGAFPTLPLGLYHQTLLTGGQTNTVVPRFMQKDLSVMQKSKITAYPVSSSCSRIGVYVDHSAGTLSFYSISDTMTLIHTVQTTFTQPLYPGFTVYKGSTLQMFDFIK